MLYQLSYISLNFSTTDPSPSTPLRVGISPAGSRYAHARETAQLWSGRRESNPRPTAWKAVTLPLSYSRFPPIPCRPYGTRISRATPSTPPSATCWARIFRPFGLVLCSRHTAATRSARQPSYAKDGLNHQRRNQSRRLSSRSSRSALRCHDSVRTANIASTASVPSLNLWSSMVANARIASIAYAPNATQNRFIEKPGAQGRIRTSVARKERQIYSLLPLTTRPPVHVPPSYGARNRHSLLSKNHALGSLWLHPRQNSATATRLCSRAFALGSCCWIQFSRRAARPVWLAPATPRGALTTITILELAKGFEPPTL